MPGLQTGNLPTKPSRRTVDQIPKAMDPSAGQRADLEAALLANGSAEPRVD
jgi:hypothetical protein